MNYDTYLNQKIDVTDLPRMNDRGHLVTLHSGPEITVREFLAGLDLAYKHQAELEKVIAGMEQFRKAHIVES